MSEKLKGKVRLYACGGAGINLGKKLEDFRGVTEVGMAALDTVYVDTSRSNVSAAIEPHCYLFDGVDGSGKVRRENHEQISSHTRDILLKFGPQDLNIVVSSASGGSGSVIAPSIVSELLERDLPTVVILIGATDTRLEIDNTHKTIKSYEAISKLRKAPVVVAYMENSKDTPRQAVDQAIVVLISGLLSFYSRENAELDSRDLFNFLHFDKVTSYQPQLASLTFHTETLPADIAESVITVASLCRAGESSTLEFPVDYQCVGYLPDNVDERIRQIAPLQLAVTANMFASVGKQLSARLDVLNQAQRARVSPGSVLSDKDEATDTGLVL